MKKVLKLALIGLGARGRGLLCNNILHMEEVVVSAVCDAYEDRVAEAAKFVTDAGFPAPIQVTDYRELLNANIDAVVVATAWESHIEIACAFMRAGIAVGIEVGGTYDIEECWELVRCYEETKTPFMFLENACYTKDDLVATTLARHGLLGEIVYCEGGYCHDIRSEVAGGIKNHHYRLNHYLTRNCENYPTHELGPIAKVLNLNRGNRILSLTSVSSKAAGMAQFIKDNEEYRKDLGDKVFAQGDVVITTLLCESGALIRLKLDTTLPRAYESERGFSGTKGFYNATTASIILDGQYEEGLSYRSFYDSITNYYDDYLPPEWQGVTPEMIEAGHGGIDYLCLKHFFQGVLNGTELPIDVYDAALWMAVTPLSAESIALGGVPVEVPDFTRGAYKTRPTKDVCKLVPKKNNTTIMEEA